MEATQPDKIKNKKNSPKRLKSESNNKAVVFGATGSMLKINGVDFPVWMECTWRRITCGKNACLFCGRINKNRELHIDRGEDPDSMEAALEDVSGNFKEVFKMIKADADSKGIDIENLKDVDNMKEPPEPEKFRLYKKIMAWHDSTFDVIEDALLAGQDWADGDHGLDLAWYANLLPAKTYRQLCNRWFLDNGEDYGDFDFEYTAYVLKECMDAVKNSLLGQMSLGEPDAVGADWKTRRQLLTLYDGINKLEKQINKI
ncbi:MAG: hypothetical protein Q8Q06_02550 [bacterium]|nr:hypothetical protein [bacterium]